MVFAFYTGLWLSRHAFSHCFLSALYEYSLCVCVSVYTALCGAFLFDFVAFARNFYFFWFSCILFRHDSESDSLFFFFQTLCVTRRSLFCSIILIIHDWKRIIYTGEIHEIEKLQNSLFFFFKQENASLAQELKRTRDRKRDEERDTQTKQIVAMKIQNNYSQGPKSE